MSLKAGLLHNDIHCERAILMFWSNVRQTCYAHSHRRGTVGSEILNLRVTDMFVQVTSET